MNWIDLWIDRYDTRMMQWIYFTLYNMPPALACFSWSACNHGLSTSTLITRMRLEEADM